jgi:hypothetical protein
MSGKSLVKPATLGKVDIFQVLPLEDVARAATLVKFARYEMLPEQDTADLQEK